MESLTGLADAAEEPMERPDNEAKGTRMSSDPNKKSARTFQCRDVLWETFEQMARELECSVDYLINEAMKQYARQRSYGTRTPFPAPGRGVEQGPSSGMGLPTPAAPPPAQARAMPAASPPSRVPPPPMRSGGLPVPPPRGAGHMVPPPPRTPGLGYAQPNPSTSRPPAPRTVPPPLPRSAPPLPSTNGYPQTSLGGGTLSVIYQGERMPVTKERFVIGRGKQSSDLTLKDPNVSRQHAMIEFQNGVYFMVDMGSTNGVEFNGQRIARKQIGEGDVFRICDHDLRFTYR